jgi:hypothetical protein
VHLGVIDADAFTCVGRPSLAAFSPRSSFTTAASGRLRYLTGGRISVFMSFSICSVLRRSGQRSEMKMVAAVATAPLPGFVKDATNSSLRLIANERGVVQWRRGLI